MKKFSNVILTFFSAGVIASLFAGAIAVIGFIVAMFIGGETAAAMCVFIHKTYFPWVIKFTSVFVGFGLLGMYLTNKKALALSADKEQEVEE